MLFRSRFSAIFDRTAARQAFRQVPWTYALAHVLFFAFTLPLYLLRIESIPAELWFLLSVFFVVGMFPGKLLIGWVLRRSRSEGSRRKERPAHWILRWIAWIPLVASIAIYVGFLYLGKFALWEGGASVLFQHAFLPPVPFYIR